MADSGVAEYMAGCAVANGNVGGVLSEDQGGSHMG